MSSPVLRLLLTVWVLLVLARAARTAWQQRGLALAVWRAVRPRHVLGGLALLGLLGATMLVLTSAAPVLGRGLGDLVGSSANVVFAPVEAAARATGPSAGGGAGPGDLAFVGLASLFLGGLVLLLPWLAFVEEEVFRAGGEQRGPATRIGVAVVFGAAHLLVLVPVAAALALVIAGLAYDVAYRRGLARTAAPPLAARRAFRPTRRSERALDQQLGVHGATHSPVAGPPDGPTVAAVTPGGVVGGVVVRATTDGPTRGPLRDRQVAGVFAATVWHTVTNTLVVLAVWALLVVDVLGA